METLLNSGIGIILAFQSLGEWLLAPMKLFRFLYSRASHNLLVF